MNVFSVVVCFFGFACAVVLLFIFLVPSFFFSSSSYSACSSQTISRYAFSKRARSSSQRFSGVLPSSISYSFFFSACSASSRSIFSRVKLEIFMPSKYSKLSSGSYFLAASSASNSEIARLLITREPATTSRTNLTRLARRSSSIRSVSRWCCFLRS